MTELIRLRASSLPELFDCPARWEARNIKKLYMPKSGAATLGTAVHAGAAAFDTCRIQGSPITPDDAAGVVADKIAHPEEEVDWGDDKPSDVEKIAIALHTLYCTEIAQKFEYAAVEADCDRLELPELGIYLTGTTDRVYRDADGNYGIADIKTGKAAVASDGTVKTSGHAAQLGIYELLAWQGSGLKIEAPAKILGLQVSKTEKGRRAGIASVTGAMSLVAGDTDEPGLLEVAANILKSGLFYGNQKSQICSEKYCPAYKTCRWRR